MKLKDIRALVNRATPQIRQSKGKEIQFLTVDCQDAQSELTESMGDLFPLLLKVAETACSADFHEVTCLSVGGGFCDCARAKLNAALGLLESADG